MHDQDGGRWVLRVRLGTIGGPCVIDTRAPDERGGDTVVSPPFTCLSLDLCRRGSRGTGDQAKTKSVTSIGAALAKVMTSVI